MGVYVSPGVYSKEKDISEIVPALASSTAAIVGYSTKGNTEEVVLITSDQQFVEEYGEPDNSLGHYFHHSALAYLEKGNTLYCLRVTNGALYGGVNIMASTSSLSNVAFSSGQSSSDFTVASGMEADVLFQVLTANPGVWGNKIGVTITDIKDGSETEPTEQYTFVINVYYQDDDGNYNKVEAFKVSRKQKRDGFGKQLYLEDVINGMSAYIRVADNANLVTTVLPKEQSNRLNFASGSDGSALTSSDLVNGWKEFQNPDDIDIRLLINGGETAIPVQLEMKTIAEDRADCVALLDMPYSSVSSVTDMITFRTVTQNFNSSYCALYAPWVQIYDRYNDVLIDVPPSGYVASQCAYNDFVGQPWDAPAGFTRGILNVIKPTKILTHGERNSIYPKQINPIQMFRGEGNVIFGQKTEQSKSSALSRLNVRRSLIVIEKAMSIALRPFLFENNTEITRFRITAVLEQYLDRLSAQGAFQTEDGDKGYQIVCSTKNNTPAVIDNNELRVDVFVKPVRTVEFIQIQTIVTSSGASFEEMIARGIIF
jgi:phage tail sheath protein FI